MKNIIRNKSYIKIDCITELVQNCSEEWLYISWSILQKENKTCNIAEGLMIFNKQIKLENLHTSFLSLAIMF